MGSVGELSTVCSQIVLKCLYLARIGRPDILWSVNKLARAVTKWIQNCDKRLARLISYIHHTREFRQYCFVENTAQQCSRGLFQDSDFAGGLEDSTSTSGGLFCIFVKHLCQSVGCARNRPQSHAAQKKVRLFLWMQVYECDPWTLRLKYFIPHQTKSTNPKIRSHKETCLGTPHST